MLNWGKKEKRLDPAYYVPSIVALEEKVLKKATKNGIVMRLRHYIKNMAGGATPKVEDESKYSDADNGIPFIRVQNLSTEGILSLDDVKYISKDTHEKDLRRSGFNDQDLLVKITGVGRMAVASVAPEGCSGNINQHSVRIVTGDRAISETVAAYLNLDFVEKLASRRSTGGTRPALDYPALRSIPVIYDERIADMLRKARETKQNDEKKAQDLLDGIDSYLLSELGIELPEKPENSIENRKFKKCFYDISGKRLDPYYHQEYFEQLCNAVEKSTYSVVYLKDTFAEKEVKGYLPKSEEKEGVNKVVQINSINKWGIIDTNDLLMGGDVFKKKQALKVNDILVVITGATIGKIGYWNIDSPSYYLGGDIIKFSTKNDVNSSYVYAYLRSTPAQVELKKHITGATNGHLSPNDIRRLRIPLPKLSKQSDIAKNIGKVRDSAFDLIAMANQNFENNKSDIEELILNENE